MEVTTSTVVVPYNTELIEMPELEMVPPELAPPEPESQVPEPEQAATPESPVSEPYTVVEPVTPGKRKKARMEPMRYVAPDLPPLPESWGPPSDIFEDLHKAVQAAQKQSEPPPDTRLEDENIMLRFLLGATSALFIGMITGAMLSHYLSKTHE